MGPLPPSPTTGCDQACPSGPPVAFVLLHLEGGDTHTLCCTPLPWGGPPHDLGSREPIPAWLGGGLSFDEGSSWWDWRKGPGLMLLPGQASTWRLWSETGPLPHTPALTHHSTYRSAVHCARSWPLWAEASNPPPHTHTPVACHLHWTRAQDSCPPRALVLCSSHTTATGTRSSQWEGAPLVFFSALCLFLQIL